jgi:hypothetical protein
MTDEKKTETAVVKAETNTALAVLGKYETNREQVQEFLDDGGLTFSDLPQIKVPAAGGKNWEMPDGTAQQSFKAVVLMQRETRAYWNPTAADGGPPDCSSNDGDVGHGNNGQPGNTHDCHSCPWAQFGTAVNDKGEPGGGQACKLVTNMVVVCDEAGRLPAIVPLPPTSSKAARGFRNRVFARDRRRHEVLAEFTLEQKQGAFKYSVADINIAGELGADDVARVTAVSEMFLPPISRMFDARQGDAPSE